MPPNSPKLARALLFPAVLFAIIAGFYWKLIFTRQFDWIWGPDLANQVLPWFQVQAEQWHHGHFPLWDPYLWAGQPLLGQAQPGGAYPLNWILFLLPLHRGKINTDGLQWYFVVIHYMAALFCYFLCRELGRSRAASLAGGIVFTLSAYMGTSDWPQMINGVVWAPLVFLFQLRAIGGRKPLASAALSGMFLGISWLSGHHQVPTFLTYAWGAVWLYYILRNKTLDWRLLRLAIVGACFMALTGALQILPAYEYGKLAQRWAGAGTMLKWNQVVPYYVHARYGMFPHDLLAIVFPAFHSNSDPYVGIVAFTLALVAIACAWRERWVPLFAAIALGAIVYALGQFSVFQGLLYSLAPMLEKARVPSVAVFLFGLGVSILAAAGIDAIPSLNASPWPPRIIRSLLIFGALTFAILFGVYAANQLKVEFDDRILITAFAALLLAALLHAWRSANLTRTQAVSLLVLLLLFELGAKHTFLPADRTDKGRTLWLDRLRGNTDIAGFLRTETQPFRIESEDDDVPLDWSEWNGFYAIKATTASVTSNILDYGFSTREYRLLFGVRFTIARKPTMDGQREVYTGASGLKVYENPGAFPIAWAVHRIERVSPPPAGGQIVQHRLSELHDMAFLYDAPPALETCVAAGEQVTINRLTGGDANLTAQLNCTGLVVVSDTFYPGWKATVDGVPARIYEVNGSMRGIVAPPGSHRIGMRYLPASVYLGALLTALGILGACGISWNPLTYRRKAGTMNVKNVF